MARPIAAVLTLGVLIGLSAACSGDEGGGGGDGNGEFHFTSGFVFVRDDNQDVYVADRADYAAVSRLTTNGGNRHPSLSDDGRQVVFVHTDAAGVSSIMTVSASGGAAPRIVYAADPSRGEKGFGNPVFSPDGATVIFSYESHAVSYLATVSAADGSGFSTLTGAPLSYGTPTFYPESVHANEVLAAAGDSIGEYTQLERVNVVTGRNLPVTRDLGPEAESISGRAVLSQDGTRVAFEARLAGRATTTRIFLHALDTGLTVRISEPSAGSGEALHSFPTWVSEAKVAFVSDEGGARQVYVQGVGGAPGTGTLTLPSADQPWYGPE